MNYKIIYKFETLGFKINRDNICKKKHSKFLSTAKQSLRL